MPSDPSGALRALIAEDNPVNQAMAKAMLSRLGFEVVTAGDGEQALDALASHPFHIVFMDLEMPVMDGYAATRQLRRREAERNLPRMPVIALSAHAEPEHQKACLDAGMDDCLSKPLQREQLGAMAAKWAPGGAGRSGSTVS